MTLDSKAPSGPLADKWDRHKFEIKLVNPANKRKFTRHRRRHRTGGRVGGRVARRAGLQRPELLHPRQPAPRAQHRRAGRHQRREELPERRRQRLPPLLRHDQGRRLPRARGQRLPPGAAVSVNIIDQCVAQGVPFAREYGGLLDNRSFGGAQVSRTFYARGQTGPAAAARRLSVADAAGARRDGQAVRAPRDARPGRRRRQGARHHRAAT